MFIVSTFQRESMFAALHSGINSLKSSLHRLTGKPNAQRGRAKVRDGIISATIFLGATSVDQYSIVLEY